MLRPLGVGYPAIVDEDPFAPIDQAAPDAKSRLLVRTRREYRLLRIPLIQRNRSLTISPPPPATTYVRRTHLSVAGSRSGKTRPRSESNFEFITGYSRRCPLGQT